MYFLAYTGLRWGEVAALNVGRIDFLRGRVLVAKSVTPVGGQNPFGDTKNHESREVAPRFPMTLWLGMRGQVPRYSVFTGGPAR